MASNQFGTTGALERGIQMSALRDQIRSLIDSMPEAQLQELLEFAQFLALEEKRAQWRAFEEAQFTRVCCPGEPDCPGLI